MREYVPLVSEVDVVVELQKIEYGSSRKAICQARRRGAGGYKCDGRLVVGIDAQCIVDAQSR